MKHFLKITFVVTIICMHSNSHAMFHESSNPADYVAPVLGGMAAGYIYERSLYRLPLILAVPTVLGALATHAICAGMFLNNENQMIATGVAASLTAIALYMREQDMREQAPRKQEIIIIERGI